MTSLEMIPQARPEPPRDRYGRYQIDGQVWTRATTLAGAIDDRYNLELWQQRMVAIGLAQRPDLLALVLAAGEDKAKLGPLCEQAQEVAKARAGANMGTALHALCEQADFGQKVSLPPDIQRDVDAYLACIAAAKLTIDPRYIERIVLCRQIGCAGTFDRLVTIDGRLHVADLKTGSTLDHSHLSIAQQLSIYANAEQIYDVATNTLTPMPEVDKTRALVIHLPSGTGHCTLHWVDIVAGWEAAQISYAVRSNWRKRKLITTFDTPGAPTSAERIPAVEGREGGGVGEVPALLPGTRDALRARSRTLNAEQVAYVRQRWPADIPKLSDDAGHTTMQLRRIHTLIVEAETFVGLPSEAPCAPSSAPATVTATGRSDGPTGPPATTTSPNSPDPFDGSPTQSTPSEGATLPSQDTEAIAQRYQALTPERQSLIQLCLTEAVAIHGVGFGLNEQVTERRFDTMTGLVLAIDMGLSPDVIRTLVDISLAEETPPIATLGAALGAMGHHEAHLFAELVRAVGDNRIPLTNAHNIALKTMPILAALARDLRQTTIST